MTNERREVCMCGKPMYRMMVQTGEGRLHVGYYCSDCKSMRDLNFDLVNPMLGLRGKKRASTKDVNL